MSESIARSERTPTGVFSILLRACSILGLPCCKNGLLHLMTVVLASAAFLVGCSGVDAKKADVGGSSSANGGSSGASDTSSVGGSSNATASGGTSNPDVTTGAAATGGVPASGGATASSTSMGGTAATSNTSTGSSALLGGVTSTGGSHTNLGGGTSAGGNTGTVTSSSGGTSIAIGGGTSAAGGFSGVGGSAGGTSSQSTCPTDCNDGFSCTVDTCVNGKCQSVIGPTTGTTACPVGQYCTVNAGCIAAPVCATVEQCQNAWKDDACKANLRCDAASSLCMFSVLDKDNDGHAPLVCGGDDCDDGNPSIHPGAGEQCNNLDDDCDGAIDDNDSRSCKVSEFCFNGTCMCKPENLCSSKCVDLQTDATNCGGCGQKCATGASCMAGACLCPTGQLECVGACSNPDAATSKCPAVVQLAPGGVQTCILLNDGSARCWGLNSDGELGNGTTVTSAKPVLVQNLTDGIQLAGGYAHNCALHGTGTVNCWGDKSLRETSIGQLAGVVEISAGSGFHSCARLTDGSVTCWGSIFYVSDIANGTPVVYSSSSLIPDVDGSVELSSGYEHSCARLADSTLKCWGWNAFGQLGDGTMNNQTTAVTVQGIVGAAGIAVGGLHTCARLSDGTVACWGDYSYGQLGDVSAYLASVSLSEDAGVPPGLPPVLIEGISDTVQIVAGRFHSCALLGNGTVKCWGANGGGQLGNGTTSNSPSPVTVQGLSNGVEVRAGAYHTCARLADGTIKCWGSNTFGQLGDGTTNDSPVPVTVSGF